MSRSENVYLFFVLSDSRTTPKATAELFANSFMERLKGIALQAGHRVVEARIVTMEELTEMRTTMYDRVNVFFTSYEQVRIAEQLAGLRHHWRVTVLTGGRARGIVHVVDKGAYATLPEDVLVDLLAGI